MGTSFLPFLQRGTVSAAHTSLRRFLWGLKVGIVSLRLTKIDKDRKKYSDLAIFFSIFAVVWRILLLPQIIFCKMYTVSSIPLSSPSVHIRNIVLLNGKRGKFVFVVVCVFGNLKSCATNGRHNCQYDKTLFLCLRCDSQRAFRFVLDCLSGHPSVRPFVNFMTESLSNRLHQQFLVDLFQTLHTCC